MRIGKTSFTHLSSLFARRIRALAPLGVGVALAMSACSSGTAAPDGKVDLRLGYFANITHASAIVGVEKGLFAQALGSAATLRPSIFSAGPEVVSAVFAGAIDAAYIGPNPTINAYSRSKGEAIRIVSGATSGGAYLVVRESIRAPDDLRGKKIAAPQLGNTQDVALRSWLGSKGLSTTVEGGGDVSVVNQENSQSLETFRSGAIDGAWVPEPWASRLVIEGGGVVLVDERDLWPGGRYVTTHLIVRTAFLRDHPDVVARLVRGQVEANKFLNENATEAKLAIGNAIERLAGKRLPAEIIARAWPNLTFTNDPIASSLHESAKAAEKLGLIEPFDLAGIYDLGPLNAVLAEQGAQPVKT